MAEYNKQKAFKTRIQKLLDRMEKLNKQHQEQISQQRVVQHNNSTPTQSNIQPPSNAYTDIADIIEGLRMGRSFSEQQKFALNRRSLQYNANYDFERRNVFKRLRKSQRNVFQRLQNKNANALTSDEKMLKTKMQNDFSDSRNERQMNWRERKRLYTRIRSYERSR